MPAKVNEPNNPSEFARVAAQICSILRVSAIVVLGVLPAALLTIPLALFLAASGSIESWLLAMAVILPALMGTAGLWGAAFHHVDDRPFPLGVTIALLACGLLVAGSVLIDAPSAQGGGLNWFTIFLLSPVGCALYFFVEQLVLMLLKRRKASNDSLERMVHE